MTVNWNDKLFISNVRKKGLDGVEEWCRVEWRPQAYRDAPKLSTTMAESLGVERDDQANCCYVGGGGAASSYILKQELDRSLHHEVGKAGFISDTVANNINTLPQYVKKHIG